MNFSSAEITALIGQWFWPFVRISAVLMSAPMFSQRSMPRRVRVLFAAVLAAMLAPTLPPMPAVDAASPAGMITMAQQVLIGTLMGFTLTLALNAVMMAGEKISLGMGFGFATMIDPQNGVSVPVLSQLYQLLAMSIFLGMNGHLTLIAAITQSFQSLPVGSSAIGTAQIMDVIRYSSSLWVTGLMIALPVLMGTLLINLAMGVMSRAAPQLNLMSVGFPFTIGVGFLLMWLLMPSSINYMGRVWNEAFTVVDRVIGG